ncbi:hypothetical protein J2S05_001654 [Alkalicoccobacillus murimartini]|uniref:Transposase n=1 Tax=Alkalicoccobacillus murimartini TaxID=171685 RepID=A0ABT9YGA4_9BACI|nr:hypothetical protein [Alkalicoccobacillus murimartini]
MLKKVECCAEIPGMRNYDAVVRGFFISCSKIYKTLKKEAFVLKKIERPHRNQKTRLIRQGLHTFIRFLLVLHTHSARDTAS